MSIPAMPKPGFLGQAREHLTVAASLIALTVNLGAPLSAAAQDRTPASHQNASPIQHVIIVIGENRSFDHVFATYIPKKGQTVSNLLSKGIVNVDGTPGPNYSISQQYTAQDTGKYSNSPGKKVALVNNPPVVTGGPEVAYGEQLLDAGVITSPEQIEPGYLPNASYNLLLTGGTGLNDAYVGPDTRIPDVMHLPGGAFQLTPGVPYDAYANSPVHRYYQMWQQSDCNVLNATVNNPAGCLHDLFPWVEVTVGAGTNGLPRPTPFSSYTTGEGSTSMEFYNVQQGDAPYLNYLAHKYTLSDNYHQAGMGGTGLNHILFGYADAIWYSDGNGNPLTPIAAQIENPNALPGTNNWYTEDGYGGFDSTTKTPYGGGSYSNCADLNQPGVPAVVNYLQSLKKPIHPNCQTGGYYYLLNNYNPGYNADGTLEVNNNNNFASFTLPPTSVRHIGDPLMEANISFKYYGDGWNLYLSDPNYTNPLDEYCNICNPFLYASDIMTNGTLREEHLGDMSNFYEDLQAGELPAVSILKPSGFVDGHPASSKLDLFEAFTEKIVDSVQASPDWKSTAIFITFDESGGYYDSGYIQPLDFFGDGARTVLLIVSPFTEGGIVNHSYSDHVSLTKFIERNWALGPLTTRSRDNDPNPITTKSNPYVPTNSPAIDDLFDAFNFGGARK